jgi:hypothetical protein
LGGRSGGDIKDEALAFHRLGDPQQAHEVVAFAGATTPVTGSGLFQQLVEVTPLLDGLHHLVDGARSHFAFATLRPQGLGEFSRDAHGLVGLHRQVAAVGKGQFHLAIGAGEEGITLPQHISGLEGAHFSLGVAGEGLADNGDDGGDGLSDSHGVLHLLKGRRTTRRPG